MTRAVKLLTLAALVLTAVLSAALSAQQPAQTSSAASNVAPAGASAAPALSELERAKLINASLLVENWSLKLQQAASELQRARDEFARLVASVTPEGYQLNEKLELVKKDK